MSVTLSNGTLTVSVAEIVAAGLSRPLRRTADELANAAGYEINSGTPGKLAGTITYLCDSYADALSIDAIYQATATVTLTTGAGAALNTLTHKAVGTLRITAERATSGKAAKWAVQAEIREV